ncbi:hypothetical protein ASZ90_006469 [hydrocarbon metagenome]|uniref:Uncharacterized protein n=1 Tax=hydrocarbon metagenome TaxID=938273 RepID=A0A0W8FS87_9ZZZZ
MLNIQTSQYVIPEWAYRRSPAHAGGSITFLDSGQDHAGMTKGI